MSSVTQYGTLGNLKKISTQYLQDQQILRRELNPDLPSRNRENIVGETVQQKRKRLFNKQTGTLNLALQGIPLWIWDNNKDYHKLLYRYTKGNCCFGHIVGMPENPKTRLLMPIQVMPSKDGCMFW